MVGVSGVSEALQVSHHEKLDGLEARMLAAGEVVDMRVRHDFTPGLYIRTIYMKAGTLLTSKIHKTRHPYAVTQGVVLVRTEGATVKIEAPFLGITEPGTRRVLFILEDTVWTTYHPTKETDLEKIEAELIERRELPDGSTHNEAYRELLDRGARELAEGGLR